MDYLNAFLCGGLLCAIGQILIDKTQLTPARILTGYVVAGIILSAIGLYEPAGPVGRSGGDGASDGLRPPAGQGGPQGGRHRRLAGGPDRGPDGGGRGRSGGGIFRGSHGSRVQAQRKAVKTGNVQFRE